MQESSEEGKRQRSARDCGLVLDSLEYEFKATSLTCDITIWSWSMLLSQYGDELPSEELVLQDLQRSCLLLFFSNPHMKWDSIFVHRIETDQSDSYLITGWVERKRLNQKPTQSTEPSQGSLHWSMPSLRKTLQRSQGSLKLRFLEHSWSFASLHYVPSLNFYVIKSNIQL